MPLSYKIRRGRQGDEQLHINLHKQIIKYKLGAANFIDKDTKQHVVYMPSLNISGYGETNDKAEEMMKFSLEDYFSYLLTLPMDKISTELAKYGWKKGLFSNEYSRTYVDGNGDLQNLNAEDNKIEHLTLTAA